MATDKCQTCGAPLEEYRIYQPETGKTVGKERACPNQYRH